MPETSGHYYIFHCTQHLEERQDLTNTVEDILHREDFICSVIDIRLLSANNDENRIS